MRSIYPFLIQRLNSYCITVYIPIVEKKPMTLAMTDESVLVLCEKAFNSFVSHILGVVTHLPTSIVYVHRGALYSYPVKCIKFTHSVI